MSSLEVGSSINLMIKERLNVYRLLQGQIPQGFGFQFEYQGTIPLPLLSVVSVVSPFPLNYNIKKNPLL